MMMFTEAKELRNIDAKTMLVRFDDEWHCCRRNPEIGTANNESAIDSSTS